MSLNEKKLSIDIIRLTNLVFGFFPVSFILGNLFVNLNVIVLCCLGFIHLKSRIFTEKYNFIIKIIFLLFFIIFLLLIFNNPFINFKD